MDKKDVKLLRDAVLKIDEIFASNIDNESKTSMIEIKNRLEKIINEWRDKHSFTSGFLIICNKCGSDSISFTANSDEHESEVIIHCSSCKNSDTQYC